ncbi:hypothetical protein ES703_60464 [subsurface metagenome]
MLSVVMLLANLSVGKLILRKGYWPSSYKSTSWLIGDWAGDRTIALHRLRLRMLGNISQAIVCILPQGS